MSATETPVVPAPNPTQLPHTEKYLRNRPFLVVNIIYRPQKNVNTSKKGWHEVAGNMSAFEQASLVDRVNDTHIRNATVIIDVMNAKLVKSQHSDTPEQEVVTHYLEKYRSQVTEAMNVWLSNIARKKADDQRIAVKNAVYSLPA